MKNVYKRQKIWEILVLYRLNDYERSHTNAQVRTNKTNSYHQNTKKGIYVY